MDVFILRRLVIRQMKQSQPCAAQSLSFRVLHLPLEKPLFLLEVLDYNEPSALDCLVERHSSIPKSAGGPAPHRLSEVDTLTDAELLGRFVKEGDREALGALFTRHGAQSFRTASSGMRRHPAAFISGVSILPSIPDSSRAP